MVRFLQLAESLFCVCHVVRWMFLVGWVIINLWSFLFAVLHPLPKYLVWNLTYNNTFYINSFLYHFRMCCRLLPKNCSDVWTLPQPQHIRELHWHGVYLCIWFSSCRHCQFEHHGCFLLRYTAVSLVALHVSWIRFDLCYIYYMDVHVHCWWTYIRTADGVSR